MHFLKKNNLKNFLLFLALASATPFLILAWTEPDSSPPNNNVSVPLNESSEDQVKSGGLSVSSLLSGSSVFTGNVGIKQTVPAYDLDVLGNINFTGDLYQNGSIFSQDTNCDEENECANILYETELDSLAEFATQIGTTGTADSTTYLRGDGAWAESSGEISLSGTSSLYSSIASDPGSSNIGNIALGYRSASANTSGDHNNFFGYQAGLSNTTGNYNNFLGYKAGYSNTSGDHNNFFGYQAGLSNTSGNYNNFLGYKAGYLNNSGHHNNFVGLSAGYSNTEGERNNFLGNAAGYSNTEGDFNNFIGGGAGYSNTIGRYNNFIGTQAGDSNVTGNYNNFIGTQAGDSNVTGNYNTGVGTRAGRSLGSGGNNISPDYSVYLGADTDSGDSSGNAQNEIVIGYNAIGAGSNSVTLGNTSITQTLLQGDVGINNSSPTYDLDVTGDINLTGDLYQNGSIFSQDTNCDEENECANILYETELDSLAEFATQIGTTGTADSTTYLRGDGAWAESSGVISLSGTSSLYSSIASDPGSSNIGNIALGYRSASANTSGDYNNFFGYQAGLSNTSGNYNNFIGRNTGYSNTSGYYNNFIGNHAGSDNTIGEYNNFIGSGSGRSNTTGDYNVTLGHSAGRYLGSGGNNISPDYSIYLGADTDSGDSSGNAQNEIVIGYNAIGAGSNSVTLGNTSITQTLLQGDVGINNSSPTYDLDVTGDINLTGDLYQNGSVFSGGGGEISLSGTSSLYSSIASDPGSSNIGNIALGYQSASANTSGDYNNFFGYRAGYSNTSGNYNNFIGRNTGYSNTSGVYNNFLGNAAGYSNTSGSKNHFIGGGAGGENTTGSKNIAIGAQSGRYLNGILYSDNISPDYSIYLGADTDSGDSSGNAQNEIVIGYNAIGAGSNSVTIGNTSITTTTLRGDVTADSFLYSSDERLKTNISEIENPLDKILKIEGVSFFWDQEKYPEYNFSNSLQYGFIAQDLEEIFPDLVNTNKEGYKSVKYANLVAPLIEAFKEQQEIIEDQEKRIEKLEEILNIK